MSRVKLPKINFHYADTDQSDQQVQAAFAKIFELARQEIKSRRLKKSDHKS